MLPLFFRNFPGLLSRFSLRLLCSRRSSFSKEKYVQWPAPPPVMLRSSFLEVELPKKAKGVQKKKEKRRSFSTTQVAIAIWSRIFIIFDFESTFPGCQKRHCIAFSIAVVFPSIVEFRFPVRVYRYVLVRIYTFFFLWGWWVEKYVPANTITSEEANKRRKNWVRGHVLNLKQHFSFAHLCSP